MRDAVVGLFLALCLAVSVGPAFAAKVTLSGEVTYRERLALPDGATLKVQLIDLTAGEAPVRVEAAASIAAGGQVPLTFTLNFDSKVIEPGHQHALVAEIGVDGQLLFRNAEPLAVDALNPAGPVTIIANFVGRLAGEDEPEMAPEPAPVAIPEPGPEPAAPALPSILDINWRADSIGGKPTVSRPDSTLTISGDMRAGGRGGCNSYFAQAELDAEAIAFSAVAATRMACLSDAISAQETAFFDALGAARFWRMAGEQLVLVDAGGAELVRFSRSGP